MLFECDKLVKTKDDRFYALDGFYPALEVIGTSLFKPDDYSAVDILNGSFVDLKDKIAYADSNRGMDAFSVFTLYVLRSSWLKFEKFYCFFLHLKDSGVNSIKNYESLYKQTWLECAVSSYAYLYCFIQTASQRAWFEENVATPFLRDFLWFEIMKTFSNVKENKAKINEQIERSLKEYDYAAETGGRIGDISDPFRKLYCNSSGKLGLQFSWRERIIFTLINRVYFMACGYSEKDIAFEEDNSILAGDIVLRSYFTKFFENNSVTMIDDEQRFLSRLSSDMQKFF